MFDIIEIDADSRNPDLLTPGAGLSCNPTSPGLKTPSHPGPPWPETARAEGAGPRDLVTSL